MQLEYPPPVSNNIAYRQNAPALANIINDDADMPELTPEDVQERITKWKSYDTLFNQLHKDAVALYDQFQLNEKTINAMILPVESYTKTQIYKLEHFLRLYHEGRCRELLDILATLLAVLRKACGTQWSNVVDIPLEPLD